MNPAVLDAFALAITAAEGPPAFRASLATSPIGLPPAKMPPLSTGR